MGKRGAARSEAVANQRKLTTFFQKAPTALPSEELSGPASASASAVGADPEAPPADGFLAAAEAAWAHAQAAQAAAAEERPRKAPRRAGGTPTKSAAGMPTSSPLRAATRESCLQSCQGVKGQKGVVPGSAPKELSPQKKVAISSELQGQRETLPESPRTLRLEVAVPDNAMSKSTCHTATQPSSDVPMLLPKVLTKKRSGPVEQAEGQKRAFSSADGPRTEAQRRFHAALEEAAVEDAPVEDAAAELAGGAGESTTAGSEIQHPFSKDKFASDKGMCSSPDQNHKGTMPVPEDTLDPFRMCSQLSSEVHGSSEAFPQKPNPATDEAVLPESPREKLASRKDSPSDFCSPGGATPESSKKKFDRGLSPSPEPHVREHVASENEMKQFPSQLGLETFGDLLEQQVPTPESTTKKLSLRERLALKGAASVAAFPPAEGVKSEVAHQPQEHKQLGGMALSWRLTFDDKAKKPRAPVTTVAAARAAAGVVVKPANSPDAQTCKSESPCPRSAGRQAREGTPQEEHEESEGVGRPCASRLRVATPLRRRLSAELSSPGSAGLPQDRTGVTHRDPKTTMSPACGAPAGDDICRSAKKEPTDTASKSSIGVGTVDASCMNMGSAWSGTSPASTSKLQTGANLLENPVAASSPQGEAASTRKLGSVETRQPAFGSDLSIPKPGAALKELRAFLDGHGIDTSECFERSDLQALCNRFEEFCKKDIEQLRVWCMSSGADLDAVLCENVEKLATLALKLEQKERHGSARSRRIAAASGNRSASSAAPASTRRCYISTSDAPATNSRPGSPGPKLMTSSRPASPAPSVSKLSSSRAASPAPSRPRPCYQMPSPVAPAVSSTSPAPKIPACGSPQGLSREEEAVQEITRIKNLRKQCYSTAAVWAMAVLDVQTRDVSVVQRAHRNLMRKLHPDRVGALTHADKTMELLQEAKACLERSFSRRWPPSAPSNAKASLKCTVAGRRRLELVWDPTESTGGAAPVQKFHVAVFDPAYGKVLTVAILEPDYNEELKRFVPVEEICSYVLLEKDFQKMPSLFRQATLTVQLAAVNDAGQSPWTILRVPLR